MIHRPNKFIDALVIIAGWTAIVCFMLLVVLP